MARGTACQLLGALNLVLRRQLFAHLFLIGRRLPIPVENFVLLPQNTLRMPVTIDAPFHLQRRRLEHQRHLIHLAVTRGAAHAFVDVNTVVEINEIRQAMHAHPINGLIGAIALTNWLEITDIIEENGMAIHARFRWRNAGDR